MFYKCKDFIVKDASGAEVNVETINDSSEVLIHVNDLRNSITIYPNIRVSGGSITANTTPVYIVSGGSIEIKDGKSYDKFYIKFTTEPYIISVEEEGDS